MRIKVREMVLVSMFAALACIAAFVVRFGGAAIVPFSLIPLISMLAGLLLGARLGALSMAVYLALGLVGLPVFASPPYGGPTYFLVPTAGFLFGFVGGAYITGKIREQFAVKGFWGYLLAALAGLVIIYLIGLPYVYGILNYYMGKALGVDKVLGIAFIPYIGFDIIKALVSAVIAVPVVRQVERAR